jgi:hypothetical protein
MSLLCCVAWLAGCKSSSDSNASGNDAGEERVLACSPATDAGVAQALDAGLTAKILKPTNGQKFSTTEKVPFLGTGNDPKEGSITDPTRMIWNIGDPVKGVNPDGEGPEDTGGPYAAGAYIVRLDVSNKACLTVADAVSITVE